MKKATVLFGVFVYILGCNSGIQKVKMDTQNLQQRCVHRLTEIIVYDVFTPPVAGRIYAYSNLAFYEAIRFQLENSPSITGQLKDFDPIPVPEAKKKYDFHLAAVNAFYKVSIQWTFSKDSLRRTQKELLDQFRNALDEETYNNSVAFGDSVGAIIISRSMKDNYRETRGMPRYSVFKEAGKWQQTPPDYADAVEPHWNKIKPLLLDSAAQFKPLPPPAYSLNKNSVYYKELMEVYNTSKDLSGNKDSIAYYWDDNPFVTNHIGHFMYATKKATPGGHWMGIAGLLCDQLKKDAVSTARVYAMASAAMLDGFIICWDEKFRSRTVRPITVIQENIERSWEPFLQTPPFPEYTSGHSVVSAAIATTLTANLGDNISFTDTTEMEFLGLKRSFTSINAAADEAGISRLYGGIHYRAAIDQGKWQGQALGRYYIEKIK